jgi:hypothetical protein
LVRPAGLAEHGTPLDGLHERQHERVTRRCRGNPTKGGDARSVVAALHAKLLKKYPGELMAPSLELVRFLRYELQTDTWCVLSRQRQASARDVLAEFEAWFESHAGDGTCGAAGSKSNTFL